MIFFKIIFNTYLEGMKNPSKRSLVSGPRFESRLREGDTGASITSKGCSVRKKRIE